MIRSLSALCAVGLAAAPLLVLAMPIVALAGALGVLLAAGGIAFNRAALVSAGSLVFLAEYAGAVWAAGGLVNAAGATGFGVALALMVDTADLARRMPRGAGDELAIARAQLGRWIRLAGASCVAAATITVSAGTIASALPVVGTPLLAAAGAVGAVLLAALVISRNAGRARSTGRGTPRRT
jgi:hypothetical protein